MITTWLASLHPMNLFTFLHHTICKPIIDNQTNIPINICWFWVYASTEYSILSSETRFCTSDDVIHSGKCTQHVKFLLASLHDTLCHIFFMDIVYHCIINVFHQLHHPDTNSSIQTVIKQIHIGADSTHKLWLLCIETQGS